MSTAHSRPISASESIIVVAIALSIALHAIVLLLRFPDAPNIRLKPTDQLEVVLVNSNSKSKPIKATAVAQTDLNGGGENEKGMVTSYLPKSDASSDGDVLQASQQAVAHLEEEQRRLLAQVKQSPIVVDPSARTSGTGSDQSSNQVDADELREQIKRAEAAIDQQIRDYAARPKRGFIGPNTRGVAYATWYANWSKCIERIGTVEYPPEARGKISGSLLLRVTLNPDGTIYRNEIKIDQSSGYAVFDRAALNIVRHATSCQSFPPEMRREYGVFEVVSRFEWTKGESFATNSVGR